VKEDETPGPFDLAPNGISGESCEHSEATQARRASFEVALGAGFL
jgi:hypothetical protein